MTTKQHIIDMYLHIRSTNQSIPDEALEFMKRTCMDALDRDDIEIPSEQVMFIKNLSHEMKTQDNRCTAQPYALVIRNKTRQIRDFDNCDDKGVHWDETSYDTFDEFVEAFKEYYLKDSETNPVIDYLNEHIEDIQDLRMYEHDFYTKFNISINTFAYEYVMTADSTHGTYEGNFFLTEKACLKHMEQNYHNFREPDTFGIHLTRNPEMEKLYEVIHALAEVL